jgi:hypothetical protein
VEQEVERVLSSNFSDLLLTRYEDEDIRKDTFGKLRDLAGVGATIHVKFVDCHGEEYLISRVFDEYENPISLRRRESVTPIELNVKDYFPVHAYSQGEALSIARNRRAQLELIDRHLDANVKVYKDEAHTAYNVLSSQIDGLVKLDSVVRDRSAYERNLATYREQIDSLNAELGRIKEAQENEVVISHQLWIEEKTYLVGLVNSIEKTRESLKSNFDRMELPLLDVPLLEKDTPNKDLVVRCKNYASELTSLKNSALEMMMKGLEDIERKIKQDARTWKADYQKHEDKYAEITKAVGGLKTKEINDQLELLGKKRFDTQAILTKIDTAEKEYRRLLKIRDENIALIRDRKARIATLRRVKVKEILKTVPRLQIVLKPDGNKDDYKAFLSENINMRGSHQKEQIIDSISETIDPFRLADLVRANDSKQIESLTGIGEWAQKIVEQLRADPSTMFGIQAIAFDDYLEISLEVEKRNYRPLEKLSTGQKATVIVSLSLIEGPFPILFDQPEDALYSPFIFENIVQLVKASKDKRQFIFATHNPNIAVGPDLDLGIVLEGSSTETSVAASGGMDDAKINELVVLHLEGGEQAIRARLKEYGI